MFDNFGLLNNFHSLLYRIGLREKTSRQMTVRFDECINNGKRSNRITDGLITIIFAIRVCGSEVSVYGFQDPIIAHLLEILIDHRQNE